MDAFKVGGVATTPIISVAEGGAGGAWEAAFSAADPTATRGTIGGLLVPGATTSLTLRVDTTLNPFFTFGAMAVPSNDFFIGNDNPMQYRLFDASSLRPKTVGQRSTPRHRRSTKRRTSTRRCRAGRSATSARATKRGPGKTSNG